MDFILRQGVDRIIVMNEGEVLMMGTPDEVKSNKAVIEAYLGAAGNQIENNADTDDDGLIDDIDVFPLNSIEWLDTEREEE